MAIQHSLTKLMGIISLLFRFLCLDMLNYGVGCGNNQYRNPLRLYNTLTLPEIELFLM